MTIEIRNKIRQHPERSCPEAASTILAEGYLAHVAYTEAEQTYLIPFSYHYDPAEPDWIYLHGSRSSHTLKYLASGVSACLEVTQMDGLVYSRSAKYHSMNYRSVVCFGNCTEISDLEQKTKILDDMIARYYPDRKADIDYISAPQGQLEGTLMVGFKINQASAKQRQGGPKGPEDTQTFATGQSGVVPLKAREDNWKPQIWSQAPFQISTEKYRINPKSLYELLKNTYWNKRLTPEGLLRRIEYSLCFGLYHAHELIGFARLVTDHDSFAYLADVVISENWRAQGLGTWLVACILEHPLMQEIRWCLLSTRDAHDLYSRQGFEAHQNPEKLMVFIPAHMKGDSSFQ
jgi:uncharacterized protein